MIINLESPFNLSKCIELLLRIYKYEVTNFWIVFQIERKIFLKIEYKGWRLPLPLLYF